MSRVRSPQTLKNAVESMFRIRMTEGAPDASGRREVWHRGTRGASLVTRVDAQGKVVRQEFFLFEDVFVWERASGVSTGAVPAAADVAQQPTLDGVAFDTNLDQRVSRLQRAEAAIGDYVGEDKYLMHLRATIFREAGATHLGADNPVTRAVERLDPEKLAELHRLARAGLDGQSPPPAPDAPPGAAAPGQAGVNRGALMVAVVMGLLLLAGAAVMLLGPGSGQ